MGHESRCTVKKGSEYLFSSGHSCGGSEDRVQAEGSPEEAEVGWLERRGEELVETTRWSKKSEETVGLEDKALFHPSTFQLLL